MIRDIEPDPLPEARELYCGVESSDDLGAQTDPLWMLQLDWPAIVHPDRGRALSRATHGDYQPLRIGQLSTFVYTP
jgi:hypothetical protein